MSHIGSEELALKAIKAAILALSCCLCIASHCWSLDLEYQVKAEFLERFTRFIEWPADSSVADPRIPFRLCVIGVNPFGTYLKQMSEEVRIKNKPVKLIDVKEPAQAEGCDLLFVSASENENLTAILEHTDGKPILTVGDSVDFVKRGMLLNFIKDGSRVVFEMNLDAVRRSRLRFSSRLMGLAKQVKEERAPK